LGILQFIKIQEISDENSTTVLLKIMRIHIGIEHGKILERWQIKDPFRKIRLVLIPASLLSGLSYV
jgi:hypothetical protein